MKRTLHVVVTDKDLERGKRGDGMRCPVARAMDRLVDAEGFPHTFVTVGRHAVWLSSGGGPSWLGWLPAEARAAIVNFDNGWSMEGGEKVEPFEFDVEVHSVPVDPRVPDPLGSCPDLAELLKHFD